MLIKIKRQDKTQVHDVVSIYRNRLGGHGLDINFKTTDDKNIRLHFDDTREVEIYIMNNEGKTIDKI